MRSAVKKLVARISKTPEPINLKFVVVTVSDNFLLCVIGFFAFDS